MSKRPYECFKCRDNGFPNTMIYLAGKDNQNKTIYVEEDGTAHQHKQKQQGQLQQQQQQQNYSGSTTVVSESTQLKIVAARLEYAISLIEKLTQAQAQEQQQQHV